MCGLVGIAGNITQKERKAMEDLLIMDQLRGFHSVGVVGVDAKGSTEVIKRAVPVLDFLDMKSWGSFLNNHDKVLIGHNRWATKGKVNTANAHPFQRGTIIGAHNGTLSNQSLLPDSKDFEVDSENIFHAIDQWGIDKTHKNLDGAYAMSWWDTATSRLNFVRNSRRTLFYAFNTAGTTLYWASEEYMLMAALSRNKIDFGKVIAFEEHVLYTFDVDKGGNTLSSSLPPPRVRKLEPFVPVYSPPSSFRSKVGEYNSSFKTHVPKIMEKHGYSYEDSIDFVATHSEGNFVHGYSFDSPVVEVITYCPDVFARRDMLAFDGYFTARCISGYRYKDGEFALTVADTDVEKSLYDETAPDDVPSSSASVLDHKGVFIDEKEFNHRYSSGCGWCSSDVSITDSDYTILDHNTIMCDECSEHVAAATA